MNDANIFELLGDATRKLKQHGKRAEAKEMATRIWDCKSYDEACKLIAEYLEAAGIDGSESDADREWDEYWAECDAS